MNSMGSDPLALSNILILAGIAISATAFAIAWHRHKQRSKPGTQLRENMEKMHRDAPFRGNRK